MTRLAAFISVCVGATQRISLSVLARNLHKERERETGSGGGKEGPRLHRESQLTKEDGREQSIWDSCPEKDTIGRRRQREDGTRAKKTVKRWVSITSGFVEVSHNYSPAIAYKCTKSCTKVSHRLSPSCAWSWPKSVFVRFFLFFHPLGCVLRICKEMCNAPSRKWEKSQDDLI